MLMMVTGGIGSGKTDFALRYAAGLGREGIYIATREPNGEAERSAPNGFLWKVMHAGLELPHVIDQINRESNIYRAQRRVVVVDSIASWLYEEYRHLSRIHALVSTLEAELSARAEAMIEAVMSFQGMIVIVSNELYGGWDDPLPEKSAFFHTAAAVNRRLAAECAELFLLTSGIPVELKRMRSR